MMQFQVGLDAICQEISAYNDMISELVDISKDVYNAIDPLVNLDWSGQAQNQFKSDMETWQSQMGKFLEDADFVNQVLSKTANVKTIAMKKICDDFVECIV